MKKQYEDNQETTKGSLSTVPRVGAGLEGYGSRNCRALKDRGSLIMFNFTSRLRGLTAGLAGQPEIYDGGRDAAANMLLLRRSHGGSVV